MSIAPETRAARHAEPVDRPSPRGKSPDLEPWLTGRVAFHLRKAAEEIDPDTPLADYGIDSVAAISICGEIEEKYRIPVSPTIAYDFPTVHAIAAHLADRLADRAADGGNPS
ncbi:acyl carrier protein [Streptomyces cinnabarinus]|uniref:Acyl carrier protein n=1 Tax=Streptomyces cinnabarinus TaxID=67287 RepID=A0ABY7KPY5_9ACTN|nr:acyl carrier protein [Streptomyces cinnabarinus]WAZ25623.1 acyl carrier protein [Streptomyces cinnabarinus]